jgi:hypothetical protein
MPSPLAGCISGALSPLVVRHLTDLTQSTAVACAVLPFRTISKMYRLTALLLALAPLLSGVAAYPTLERLSAADQTKIIARALEGRQTGNGGGLTFSPPDPTPVLVPAANDTTHQYQDPQPGDQRGPCPGRSCVSLAGTVPALTSADSSPTCLPISSYPCPCKG